MAMTVSQATELLTSKGQPFEVAREEIRGVPTLVWAIEEGEWMRISIQLIYGADFHSSLSQISEFEREGLDFV